MPDFSVIVQSPQVRAIVQENLLARQFHDALFPKMLFRGEAQPMLWPANTGDTHFDTAPGLMPTTQEPLKPGTDPLPSGYEYEQWFAQLQQYANSIDTSMPTSIQAIADLFLRNAQQLGLNAAQTMNRIVRNKMYNAGLAGQTVADGAQVATTSLRVKRLNGFTRARNPAGNSTNTVRFDPVSPQNPLLLTTPGGAASSVIGFVPDTAGDETGPGVLTLDIAVTVADRDPVLSSDCSEIVRVGGGNRVDDIGNTDLFTLDAIRSAVAQFQQNNVPEMPDGFFHMHLDPTSIQQIFADSEFQRLFTALPDHIVYKQFVVNIMMGTVFFRNSECPVTQTVQGGPTGTFLQADPFAGELFNHGVPGGVPIHRPLLVAQGGIMEYYQDLSQLITEAGVNGKVGEFSISNNGIEVFTDRIQLVIRAPQNRLQDLVSTSWKFIGDWPIRTDAATGSAARIKRFTVIEHGA